MQIRTAKPSDAARIAHVHVESWRTTYADILPSDLLDGLSVERRTAFWQHVLEDTSGTQAVFVATDEQDMLIGFAACGAERDGNKSFTGEIYALYLLASQQRQGIGTRLLQACASQLLRAGHQSMLVWVLQANAARSFYQRLGGQPISTKMIPIGTATLPEISYGWSELAALVDKSE